MTSLPLAEVKSKFSEMIDRVEDTHDRITVTRNGRPAAVIVSPEDLEALEDTLDLLSDPAAVAQLHESKKAHAAGDYVGAEVLKAKYLRR
jgi:antitoxin YefM